MVLQEHIHKIKAQEKVFNASMAFSKPSIQFMDMLQSAPALLPRRAVPDSREALARNGKARRCWRQMSRRNLAGADEPFILMQTARCPKELWAMRLDKPA
jgi:hypothetical protein